MKRIFSRKHAFFLAALLFLISAHAALSNNSDTSLASIKLSDVWVRPSQVKNSAVYMTIENTGSILDALTGAETDVCEWIELHRIDKVHGVFRMHPVKTISLPAETVTFLRPSGMHLMLINLKKPLKEGDKILLKLTFKEAGTLTVVAVVRPVSGEAHDLYPPSHPKEEIPSPSEEKTGENSSDTEAHTETLLPPRG